MISPGWGWGGGGGVECLLDRIAIWNCWNENIGGRNALDLLYLRTSFVVSPFMPGTIPKQPAFTTHTLRDVCNKYESVFHSLNSPVNFHLKLTGAISFWKLGVVHGPRSMFFVRLVEDRCFKFWSRKSEVWSLKSEVWSLKSEVGSLKSEVGSRKSEFPPRLS